MIALQRENLLHYQGRLFAIKSKPVENSRDPDHIVQILNRYIESLLLQIRDIENVDANDVSNKARSTHSAADRVKVSFSVDVLVYLVRILVNAGYIIPNSKAELFKSIAAGFMTKGVGEKHLSVLSLANKYHTVVHTTALQSRVIVMKMLKIIDAEF